MAKMWEGRTSGVTDKLADDFNSSISFDSRMFKQDISGSIAHAAMLGKTGIISQSEAETLINGLAEISEDIESGKLQIDYSCEDIHMFVEQVLTERLNANGFGELGKKLHTARSRNDQVALDLRLYLRDKITETVNALKTLTLTVCQKAEQYKNNIVPGYTHLQRAQPITFGHHLMAYAFMFVRDIERLNECANRMIVSPIGACALAGTTYKTDRGFEAQKLGFNSVAQNSIDAVSDRDYAVEMLSDLSICMMHLSRFSEEIVLWSSWEFKFVQLSDAFTTGSSIMPQKKNPDMAELVRGKTGRVYGDLLALLTTLKGLPLAYNKDMQEDKESVFDAVDTVISCLGVFNGMLNSLTAIPENMLKAAQGGFINATDLADYLVKKGMPFRSAYKISGQIVAFCINNGFVLETLPLEKYKEFASEIENDVYKAVDLKACVERRISEGGTSPDSVQKQIDFVKQKLQ